VVEVHNDIRTHEDQMVKLIQEINLKRAALEDCVRELGSLEESIESIKAMNKDMRTDQFDQEKRIKIIQGNALDL
jgi:chromosome segregation ATPase